ncbi:MAG: glycosyltransferase [Deltaproteobacteria bacterium]|nr:glycosyltransferase [Deltaproteobacteria bacterium]
MQSPLISVIIPAYNHELFVADAINSVLLQSFSDFEIIAIDDGSTDNTFGEMKKINDPRIRLFHQTNIGAAETINRGIDLSQGQYITILNSDDLYHPDRLAVFKQYMDDNPDVMVASSLVQPVDTFGKHLKPESGNAFHDYWLKWYDAAVQNLQQDDNYFFSLLQSNFVVSTSNLFLNSRILQQEKKFNPILAYCHDYAFLLRALQTHRFGFIRQKLVKYRLHDTNTIRHDHFLKRLEVQYAVFHSLNFDEVLSNLSNLQLKMSAIIFRGLEKNPDINHDIRLAEKDRMLEKSEAWLKEFQATIARDEDRIVHAESQIECLQTLIAEKDTRIRERDDHLHLLAEEIRQKDDHLHRFAEEIRQKDEDLRRFAEVNRQKNEQLQRVSEENRQKDGQLRRISEENRQKDEQLRRISDENRQKDEHLHRIAEEVRQKDIHCTDARPQVEDLISEIVELRRQCEKQEETLKMKESHEITLKSQIHLKDMLLQDIDRKIIALENIVAEKEHFLREIFASKGWRWLTRYRNIKQNLIAKSKAAPCPHPVIDDKTYQAQVLHPRNPKRPKIVHAIANFLTGGSSRLVVDLVEHLGHKYDQEVISFFIPTPLAYSGVALHDFSGDVSEKRIEAFLKEKKAEILHVHYWGEGDAPWYRKVFNAAENWSGVLIENVNTPVVPYISYRIDHYVYVSEYARDFATCEEEKSSVIYPGSNLALFDRNEAPIPDDVIGMVYRLDSDKLKEDAIRVFIQVVKKRPRTQVLIVGGGEFFNAYQTRVAEEGASANFQFTGYVPYEKLPEYYQKMSIFVAPVWKESFGQVSPFAMSMKIPVAGYHIGALPEILGSKDLLAKDPDVLADIIVNLLEDRQKRIEIGQKNYLRVHERFSVEAMVSAYDGIYEKLIREREI